MSETSARTMVAHRLKHCRLMLETIAEVLTQLEIDHEDNPEGRGILGDIGSVEERLMAICSDFE